MFVIKRLSVFNAKMSRNRIRGCMIGLLVGVLVGLLLLQAAGTALAQGGTPAKPDPSLYRWAKVVDGLENPLYLTNAGDGTGRLFAAEQAGKIWIIKNKALSKQPFLDISNIVIDEVTLGGYTERGLLGLVFAPDYAKSGLFYVDYVNRAGLSIIARYKVQANNPDLADPKSAVILLTVQQPYANHKGGQLAFGPDGYLYIAFGDGGSGGDPLGNGQKLTTMLGKILRIDVSSTSDNKPYAIPAFNPFVGRSDALPEIWAYGLRNPWRFSFDPGTGDLYIGDVGQDKWEEVDVQPANSKGGENYGWNLYEGLEQFSRNVGNVQTVKPVVVFGHDANGGCAITGGYVYRGKAIPKLNGVYFYADYCYGHIWSLYRDDSGSWKSNTFSQTGHQISSFGVDEAGELYYVDYKGSIYQLQASQ